MNNIGQRLKYFRTRQNISQMDVELAIEASFGSISRIESDKVNPTKETIEKIVQFLKLKDNEIDYLVGPSSMPTTIEECSTAIISVSEYFKKQAVIAYLVDDRYRMLQMSSSLPKILRLSDSQYEEILGRTLIELILEKKYGIRQYFEKDFEFNLRLIISRFIYEMGFMVNDEFYKLQKNIIMSDPISRNIWDELVLNPQSSSYNYNGRLIHFHYYGLNLDLRYANEQLMGNKRFCMVEYLPSDNLTRLFTKFLGFAR